MIPAQRRRGCWDDLLGGGGTDTINCGTGADAIVFKDATAFTGIATVKTFTNNSGNVLDISDIINTVDPTQASIDQFCPARYERDEFVLNINAQGSGSNWVRDRPDQRRPRR